MDQLQRPETHDKRPGMGTVEEMWRYRLAQRVRGLRLLGSGKPDGWSVRELARRAKLDHRTVLNIEKGRGCTLENLVSLSRVFGVSTDFLLGRAKVPASAHEIVDRAYEEIMSLASSMDYVIQRPAETTIRDLENTVDMLRRSLRGLVDLGYQLRYPDPGNPNTRIPYGYEFCEKMEVKLGHELDQ